jgi:type IV pilus assembly protein PilB
MDDIKFMTGYNVEPVVASEVAVIDAIAKYYGKASGQNGGSGNGRESSGASALEVASRALEDMPVLAYAGDVELLEEFEEISAEALAKQGEEAPVIKLVNVILMSAIQKGASDIHIEPYEKELRPLPHRRHP